METEGLRITDLSDQDRAILKQSFKTQISSRLEQMYPSDKYSKVEQEALLFLKHFSAADYSFKGQPSAQRSSEDALFGNDAADFGIGMLMGSQDGDRLS